MVVAVTGLILMFKDLGLPTATLQRAQITHAQVSNLFWVNAALGVVAMGVTLAGAGLLASFYGEPRLAGMASVLSLALLAGSLSAQHMALLRRQMLFGRLAVVELSSQFAAATLAVLAAWRGAGYWSLVVLHLTLPLANLVGAWIACGWRPGPPARGSGVRPLLRFGGNLTLFGAVNFLARNLDDVLIGRAWGATALGYYSKGYGLLLLPLRQINQPLAGAAIAALSRLQDDPQRYRRYYLEALRLLALITMPLVAFLFAAAGAIVLLVLGDQWEEAGRLFSILAVAAFIQPVLNTTGWVYVSLGQTDRMARWGALWAGLLCVSFLIGLPWGPRGVAWAYTVANYLLALPGLWVAYARAPVGISQVLGVLARPTVLGLAVGAAGVAVRGQLAGASPLAVIVACAGAALAALALLAAVWPALRADLAGFARLARDLKLGRDR